VDAFNQYRPLLFSIAYRMLGIPMDAEDAVQEAYLRWQQADQSEVRSPKAFLCATITRLCIDNLTSAKVQREAYVGAWIPEPLLTEKIAGIAETAELAESLSVAFLMLLESLTPIERAVFLLHEVFDYGYPEIAQFVDKSEANCRQLLKRARQAIAERRPRFDVTLEQQQDLLGHFIQTCGEGDMNGLMALLSEDITVWSDGGGKVIAALKPIYSADKAARFLLGLTKKAPANYSIQVQIINGQPGIIGYVGERVYNALVIDIGGDRIRGIYNVVNPDKLHRIEHDLL
jgi:RNA polymerase sigma-70 factor, ECF subfamily